MTDSMTYPHTTSHISLKIPSVFRHSHNNMVRSAEERFAMERMATRCFGAKKIVGGAWCAGGDNEALAAEAALGWRRGVAHYGATTWCGGGSVCLVSRVICPTSLELSCVPLVCWSMAVKKSAFVPQRSSTPGFLLSHVARSLVSGNVCRRLASSAAAAASRST